MKFKLEQTKRSPARLKHGQTTVAMVYLTDDNRKRTAEAARTARMLEAAPEMLAALQRAAPWLGKLIADGGHLQATLPADAVRTLDMVEAALAKVEGR